VALRHHDKSAGTRQTEARASNPIVRTSRLKQNAAGWWVIHYFNGQRSDRYSTRTRDRSQAEAILADWLKTAEAGPPVVDGPQRVVTIEQVIDGYLTLKIRNRRDAQVNALASPRRLLGGLRPAELNRERLESYRVLRLRDVQESSLRRELGALKTALLWGQGEGMFAEPLVKIALPPAGAPRAVWMTREQDERFWRTAQDEAGRAPEGRAGRPARALGVFVALALDTAARRQAIMQLTWDRVDLDLGIIDYRVPGQRVSRKRRAVVPICDRLAGVLARARACAPSDAAGRPFGRVVASDYTTLGVAFRRLAGRLGLAWVTPHVCRHTWASLALQDGEPIAHIAKMLADTIGTVERVYAKLTVEDLRAVANRRFVGRTQLVAITGDAA